MLEYHGKNGSTYSVKEERLGKGGEGSIHEIEHMPEYVAKIFKPDKRSLEREEKICNMTMNNMSEDVLQCITWPLDVLYDENDFVGYVMKRVKSVASLSELYSDTKYNLHIRMYAAYNLCAAIDTIHSAGQVCGDLSQKYLY